jgi:NOL1/NOP2/fmu family ribosome biogenesis protein
MKKNKTYHTVHEQADELAQKFEKYLIEEIEKAADEFKKGRVIAVQSMGRVHVLVAVPGFDHGIRIVPPHLPR